MSSGKVPGLEVLLVAVKLNESVRVLRSTIAELQSSMTLALFSPDKLAFIAYLVTATMVFASGVRT
jgi:hypothetical protein